MARQRGELGAAFKVTPASKTNEELGIDRVNCWCWIAIIAVVLFASGVLT